MAKSIMEAAKAINNGVNAIAFPEGTRSKTGILGKFYGGAFTLLCERMSRWFPSVLTEATG